MKRCASMCCVVVLGLLVLSSGGVWAESAVSPATTNTTEILMEAYMAAYEGYLEARMKNGPEVATRKEEYDLRHRELVTFLTTGQVPQPLPEVRQRSLVRPAPSSATSGGEPTSDLPEVDVAGDGLESLAVVGSGTSEADVAVAVDDIQAGMSGPASPSGEVPSVADVMSVASESVLSLTSLPSVLSSDTVGADTVASAELTLPQSEWGAGSMATEIPLSEVSGSSLTGAATVPAAVPVDETPVGAGDQRGNSGALASAAVLAPVVPVASFVEPVEIPDQTGQPPVEPAVGLSEAAAAAADDDEEEGLIDSDEVLPGPTQTATGSNDTDIDPKELDIY